MDETKNGLVNPPTPPPAPPAPGGAAPKSEDLVYNVMPQEGKSFSVNFDANKSAGAVPPPIGVGPSPSGGGSRKGMYIILGLLVVIILGGLAYYLLGTDKTTETDKQSTTKLTKTWLQQYFNAETCTDQATCGDNADPDNDGFNNFVEFKTNTNPLNPDTDSDGLADGDETKIYKTDPTLKYTDRREIVATNDWSDGYQVKNGYDPVTGAKMTEARLKQIADDIVKLKLHEPSITTTTSVAAPPATDATAGWKTYTNTQYGFEMKYPPQGSYLGRTVVLDPKDTKAVIGFEVEELGTTVGAGSSCWKQVTINTNKGSSCDYLSGTGPYSKDMQGPYRLIVLPQDIFSLEIIIMIPITSNMALYDQALSTFKFTK